MGHTWLFVALGGAVGALLRYGVGRLAVAWYGPTWPIGTAVVNIVGSFVLGFVVGLGERAVPPNARILITTGLLGAFTTFSTFSVETVTLAQRGDVVAAAGNILLNTVLGLLGAGLGLALGTSLSRG